MKMKLAAVTFFMGLATFAIAQPGNYAEIRKQESKQLTPQSAAELAKQFELSDSNAEDVWKLYTNYKKEQEDMRKSRGKKMREIRQNKSRVSDAEAESAFYEQIEARRQMLDFEEKSYVKFTGVLTPTQAVQLMHAGRKANRSRKKATAYPNKEQSLKQHKTR